MNADGGNIIRYNDAKVVNEDGIIKSEDTKVVNEDGIIKSEDTKVVNEDGIIKSEDTKVVNEDAIIKSEDAKVVNEDGIIKNENVKVMSKDNIIMSNGENKAVSSPQEENDLDALKRDYPFLARLNEQQLKAVAYTDGPQLVVAGAGSGKTTVLTTKIAYLLKRGLPAWSILALTFTNKAAREMRERVERATGVVMARSLWMGTFHSIFSRILRTEGHVFGFTPQYTVYQPSDTRSLLKSIIKEMGLDDKVYKPNVLAARISEAKNMLVTPKKYRENVGALKRDSQDNIPRLCEIYGEYFTRCHRANAMDFDDMLLYTFILLDAYPELREKYSHKFRYVLVDEFQDTNFAQMAILHLLCTRPEDADGDYDVPTICAVGDDAQSIYGFRGARIDNILSFDKAFAGTRVFKLERNYRSTQNIVNAANSLIHKNADQIPKTIYSENEVGAPLILNELSSDIEEGEMVCNHIRTIHSKGTPLHEIAVLYRTNGQSRIMEEALRKKDIPYIVYGSHSFYDKKEIKDLMAYLRLTLNLNDEEALRRIINVPARGIGDTTINKVFACAQQEHTTPWNVVNEPDLYGLNVNNGTKNKLHAFASMIKDFTQAANEGDAYQVGMKVLKDSGLYGVAQADISQEGRETMDNYSSLLSGMSQFVEQQREEGHEEEIRLGDYLSEVSLLTDSDQRDPDGDAVRLMTVHIAKGLEFDVVFITGMEQELFPSGMCVTQRENEEERRLFFVAITRARKCCYLSNAKTRFRFGKSDWYDPSEFLSDIDQKYIYVESNADDSFAKRRRQNLNEYIDFDESPSASALRPYRGGNSFSSRNSYSSPRSMTSSSRNAAPVHRNISPQRPNKPSLIPLSSPLPENDTPTAVDSARVDNGTMRVGSTVEHTTFGIGTVEGIEKSNTGLKAIISFRNFGQKTLLLKFARLKVIN